MGQRSLGFGKLMPRFARRPAFVKSNLTRHDPSVAGPGTGRSVRLSTFGENDVVRRPRQKEPVAVSKPSPARARVEGDEILVSDPRLRLVRPSSRSPANAAPARRWADLAAAPGLGRFPIRTVASLGERAPEAMRARGGLVVPIYQAEALWLNFDAPEWRPMAMKVRRSGMVNAISAGALDGKMREPAARTTSLPRRSPGSTASRPATTALASSWPCPSVQAATVEVPADRCRGRSAASNCSSPGRRPAASRPSRRGASHGYVLYRRLNRGRSRGPTMGLGAGGRMTQRIYPDPARGRHVEHQARGAHLDRLVRAAVERSDR